MEKYCTYIHRSEKDNRPFYVGCGTIERATDYNNRHSDWKTIYKSEGCIVDIVFKSNNYSEVLDKESIYILKYKRVVNGGTLINYNNGGQGAMNGEENPMYGIRYGNHPRSKSVICLDINGNFIKEYDCSVRAKDEDGFDDSLVRSVCDGHRKTHRNHIFVYKSEYDSKKDYSIKYSDKTSNAILACIRDNNKLTSKRYYTSVNDAVKKGFSKTSISRCLNGSQKEHKGFIWIRVSNLNDKTKEVIYEKFNIN